jgi:hypothetical protein
MRERSIQRMLTRAHTRGKFAINTVLLERVVVVLKLFIKLVSDRAAAAIQDWSFPLSPDSGGVLLSSRQPIRSI